MSENKCRTLTKDEVELRVGQYSKDKSLATLLLYKNARVDMALLDERFGAENWECDYKELKGNLYCGVGVRYTADGPLVWKWDCGTESKTEAEKGEASDAFKRACVRHGQGRELYTAPTIWVEAPSTGIFRDTFTISKLKYNDRREICDLEIVDKSGKTVWAMGAKKAGRTAKKEQKAETPAPTVQAPAIASKPLLTSAMVKAGRATKILQYLSAFNPDDASDFSKGMEAVEAKYNVTQEGSTALADAVRAMRATYNANA